VQGGTGQVLGACADATIWPQKTSMSPAPDAASPEICDRFCAGTSLHRVRYLMKALKLIRDVLGFEVITTPKSRGAAKHCSGPNRRESARLCSFFKQ